MPNRKQSPGEVKVVPLRRKRRVTYDPRETAFNKAFGERLKTWREGAGWSQARLATRLGISADQYKKYEYGDRAFPLYLVLVLRSATDRSLADWLQGLDYTLVISQTKAPPQ